MHISRINTFPVRIPLKVERRMVSALGRHDISEFLLVRMTTDEGVEGVGEATVTPRWSGETVWGAKAVIEHVLAPAVIGCDPQDVAELDRRMDERCVHNQFAKAALEMACWDIQGKAAGKPVYELLGGACRPLTIRSRFSLGAYEPERARRRAEELISAGFTTIKVKVGGRADKDIERVRIVRGAIGAEPDLVIDANGGWDAKTAIDCVRELEDCRLSLVEQPTPPGDYAAMAEVRRGTGCKILADESCFDLVHARELIRNACCDAISLYPGKNGGIRKAREIAEFAAEHDVACSIGSNLEWDVGAAAMAHFVVATPNVQVERYPGDLLGPDYHEFSIAKNPLLIEGPL
ncbi:MAG: muconate cycloisomerase, partial [Planctomycetes bacterium]|nr:muconate cycloisomerase [Planctomycetota bacterium]